MKYITKPGFILSLLFLLTAIPACVKENEQTFTNFSQLSDFVIIQTSGLSNVQTANIQVDATSTDTLRVPIIVSIASVNYRENNSDITVKLAVDDTKRTAYNSDNGSKFQAFTTPMYKILNTTLTIPKGQLSAKTTLEIYQNKIDPTVSYMLPISITDATGKELTSNQNTIYYNVIGNLIAGNYKWDFTRYNNNTGTGTPHSLSFTGKETGFVPVTETIVEVLSLIPL